eukprot:TRINITY_DN60687_c0_g1_i1.p1 TRINITY_DN60687_c0_g1~~TRINITY_DN60687_c0_g1_i1.p1  ORF type:complete len:282 (+),score=77.14 TRINITY_DN60687_c0_g1_i1:101-847(+)
MARARSQSVSAAAFAETSAAKAFAALGREVSDAPPCTPAGPGTLLSFVECTDEPGITLDKYLSHVLRMGVRVGCLAAEDVQGVALSMLVLMRRTESTGALALNRFTVHRLGLACFYLSQKMICEKPIALSLLARIGGVEPYDLALCERVTLVGLEWRAMVTAEEANEELQRTCGPCISPLPSNAGLLCLSPVPSPKAASLPVGSCGAGGAAAALALSPRAASHNPGESLTMRKRLARRLDAFVARIRS